MSTNKCHARDLLNAICAVVSLLANVSIAFALSAFVGGTLVAIASTDTGTTGSADVISSVVDIFFFLVSLAAIVVRTMIGVVAVDLQSEEEEVKWRRCYHWFTDAVMDAKTYEILG